VFQVKGCDCPPTSVTELVLLRRVTLYDVCSKIWLQFAGGRVALVVVLLYISTRALSCEYLFARYCVVQCCGGGVKISCSLQKCQSHLPMATMYFYNRAADVSADCSICFLAEKLVLSFLIISSWTRCSGTMNHFSL
jgi:hypothetical protein